MVLAKAVVDATGNADVAVAAGANWRFMGGEVFALQGVGLSPRAPGQRYTNSDWTFVNDSDALDRTRTHVVGLGKYRALFDVSPHIDSRERRSVVGATILDAPGDTSRPLLRAAHERAARPEFKLALAELLAMLDDPAGAATLLAALETAPQWDEGWRFQGMANHGAGYSRLDSVILDLAAIGHRPAVGAILAKLRRLSGASEFSHFRCCALALEQFRAPEAAPVLAELLGREGLGGHATADLAAAFRNAPAPQDPYANQNETQTRERTLRELLLARALLACGDRDGLGRRILHRYAEDVHGVYRLHARAALAAAARSN